MKSNYLFILLVLGMMFLGVGGVCAVECGTVPIDGCTATKSITFDTGIYYFNTSIGAIGVTNTNDTIVDCNYSKFIGNWNGSVSDSTRGIKFQNVSNITLKNCYFENYFRGVYFLLGVNNTYFENIEINVSYYNFNFDSTMYNSTIRNSRFNNATLYNVYIQNDATDFYSNISIINTTLSNSLDYKVRGGNAHGLYLDNNNFSGLFYGGYYLSNCLDLDVFNHNLSNYDQGGNDTIYYYNSTGNVYNNYFNNIKGLGYEIYCK
jgi:hypothetical protein